MHRKEAWAVLTDFAAYPEWKPFITSISGELEVGALLEITIKPCGWSSPFAGPPVGCALLEPCARTITPSVHLACLS